MENYTQISTDVYALHSILQIACSFLLFPKHSCLMKIPDFYSYFIIIRHQSFYLILVGFKAMVSLPVSLGKETGLWTLLLGCLERNQCDLNGSPVPKMVLMQENFLHIQFIIGVQQMAGSWYAFRIFQGHCGDDRESLLLLFSC